MEIRINVQISNECIERLRRSLNQHSSSIEQIADFAPSSEISQAVMRGVTFSAYKSLQAQPPSPRQQSETQDEVIRLIQAPWYGSKIQEWCDRHGYTEPFFQDHQWWAFPPQGVMPVQLEDVMNGSQSRPN